MAFQVVRQHAQGAGRAAHLLRAWSPSCDAERRVRLTSLSALSSVLPLSSAHERLVEVRSIGLVCRSSLMPLKAIWSSFSTMLFTLRLQALELAGYRRQLRRVLATSRCWRRGASGKKSKATKRAPVSRLPVRSCARTPCATRLSISWRRSASQVRARAAGPHLHARAAGLRAGS